MILDWGGRQLTELHTTTNRRGPKRNLRRHHAIIRALTKHLNICTVARLFAVSRQRIHQVARINGFDLSTLCGFRQGYAQKRHRTDRRYAKTVAHLRRDPTFAITAAASELGVTKASLYEYLRTRGIASPKGHCFICRRMIIVRRGPWVVPFHICFSCHRTTLGRLAGGFRYLYEKFPRLFYQLVKTIPQGKSQ